LSEENGDMKRRPEQGNRKMETEKWRMETGKNNC